MLNPVFKSTFDYVELALSLMWEGFSQNSLTISLKDQEFLPSFHATSQIRSVKSCKCICQNELSLLHHQVISVLNDNLLSSFNPVELANLLIPLFDYLQTEAFPLGECIFSHHLGILPPQLDGLSLLRHVESQEDAVPVGLGSLMLSFEVKPRCQNLIGKPVSTNLPIFETSRLM